jgi:hypothetical protein
MLLSAILGSAALADPPKATPEEAKALLTKAVKELQTAGEAKALAAFSDPKGAFIDRELYVFCFGPDNKITAHFDHSRIGADLATYKDPEGKEFGKEMIEVGKKGEGSVEYKWMNPVSKKVEPKLSFIKKTGQQICGVGVYR